MWGYPTSWRGGKGKKGSTTKAKGLYIFGWRNGVKKVLRLKEFWVPKRDHPWGNEEKKRCNLEEDSIAKGKRTLPGQNREGVDIPTEQGRAPWIWLEQEGEGKRKWDKLSLRGKREKGKAAAPHPGVTFAPGGGGRGPGDSKPA